jgi:hypothetical protein
MSLCAALVSRLFSLCQYGIIDNDGRVPREWFLESFRHVYFSRD